MKKTYILIAFIALLAAALACSPTGSGVEIPEDWVYYTSSDLGITVYFPDNWEYYEYDEFNFDIEDDTGTYWLEFYLVNEASEDEFEINYDPAFSSEELLDEFLATAEEGLTIGEYESLTTRAGTATTVELEYEGEDIFVVALQQESHGFFFLAWGDDSGLISEDGLQLYKDIIATTGTEEE